MMRFGLALLVFALLPNAAWAVADGIFPMLFPSMWLFICTLWLLIAIDIIFVRKYFNKYPLAETIRGSIKINLFTVFVGSIMIWIIYALLQTGFRYLIWYTFHVDFYYIEHGCAAFIGYLLGLSFIAIAGKAPIWELILYSSVYYLIGFYLLRSFFWSRRLSGEYAKEYIKSTTLKSTALYFGIILLAYILLIIFYLVPNGKSSFVAWM